MEIAQVSTVEGCPLSGVPLYVKFILALLPYNVLVKKLHVDTRRASVIYQQ